MSHRYYKLLEPVTVRGFNLKHRIYASNSQPHFLQGPENYPSEGVIRHIAGRAKNGAAMVTIGQINSQAGMPKDLPAELDVAHFPDYNIYEPACQNYLMQLADMVHLYKSLCIGALFAAGHTFPLRHPNGQIEMIRAQAGPGEMPPMDEPPKDGPEDDGPYMGLTMETYVTDALSVENLEKIADSFAQQAQILQTLGFDGVMIHMCYRGQLLGQMISPITNLRTDAFGGDIEGRSRFPLMVFKKIREAVGNYFLIELPSS